MLTQRRYVAVDSNLLLLLTVGLWNPRALSTQKRLGGSTAGYFELLRDFLSSFETVVTTAHILREVSNLAGAASGQSRIAIFSQLSSLCKVLEERTVAGTLIADKPQFRLFGVTDTVLSELCREMVLLTQDGRLAAHLQANGLYALSLQDVRALRERANRG